MDHTPSRAGWRPPKEPENAHLVGYLVGPLLVILAIYMWAESKTNEVPSAATPAFDFELLSTGPRRDVLGDPPVTLVAGFKQRCNACHKLFTSTWDGTRALQQHTHIEMGHGINHSCANCHAREDRERLVLHDGTDVAYAEVGTLCRQCHGPVYRDWTRGAHGKTVGSWIPGSADAERLTCTACHDPHSPRYEGIKPLPGPNTLRMGDPSETVRHQSNNPLRRWELGGAGHDEGAH